ncbi:MAG: hypothetical protein LBS25_00710 [Candidatus Symbiothrix sp.]|jgi:hypothetical protein|nr:hypothetical protein [Candidatus Symbiothrix sp.]
MDRIFINIMQRLQQVAGLRFVGEDWGQLNFEQPPVDFPCALIDLGRVDYSNRGRNVQQAKATLIITIADIRYDGVAPFNPDDVNEQAFSIFRLIEDANRMLHGYGTEYHSKLMRVKTEKTLRDDAIREFQLIYEFGFEDETASPALSLQDIPPNIVVNAK